MRASARWSPTCWRPCTTPTASAWPPRRSTCTNAWSSIDVSEDRDQPLVLINPEIIWASDEMAINEEGCLSVPAIYDGVRARHLASRCPALDGDGRAASSTPRAAGGVRPARDGPPAGQGVRRVPVAAQAQPHQDQDARRARNTARAGPGRQAPGAAPPARSAKVLDPATLRSFAGTPNSPGPWRHRRGRLRDAAGPDPARPARPAAA